MYLYLCIFVTGILKSTESEEEPLEVRSILKHTSSAEADDKADNSPGNQGILKADPSSTSSHTEPHHGILRSTSHENAEPQHGILRRDSTDHDNAEPQHGILRVDSTCHDNAEPQHGILRRDSTDHDNVEPHHGILRRDSTDHDSSEPQHGILKREHSGDKTAVHSILKKDTHITEKQESKSILKKQSSFESKPVSEKVVHRYESSRTLSESHTSGDSNSLDEQTDSVSEITDPGQSQPVSESQTDTKDSKIILKSQPEKVTMSVTETKSSVVSRTICDAEGSEASDSGSERTVTRIKNEAVARRRMREVRKSER